MERKGDRMHDALIEKILDEMGDIPADLPVDVNLTRVNGPFLDKRVMDVALEINRRFSEASLWLFTNASPLLPKVAQRLTELRSVAYFVVSFNEHRPAMYERVMKIPFERTVANLDHLHEMHAAGALAFTPTISKVGDGTPADDDFLVWVRDRWPTFASRVTDRFSWIDGAAGHSSAGVPNVGCWQWFHLPILASGKVAHCCIDHEGRHAWGDVNETHILDIYNEPSRRALREHTPSRVGVEGRNGCSHYG